MMNRKPISHHALLQSVLVTVLMRSLPFAMISLSQMLNPIEIQFTLWAQSPIEKP